MRYVRHGLDFPAMSLEEDDDMNLEHFSAKDKVDVHLWEVCNILRGTFDKFYESKGEFKTP